MIVITKLIYTRHDIWMVRIAYIPHLLWWFTAINMTQKMLHKCSVLLIIIIQRILRWIVSTSFLQQFWSPFYSVCSFHSLLIKSDFSQWMLIFFLFECLTQQSWARSIPQHSPPYCSVSALQPLVLHQPPLEKATALEKHFREKLSCFHETHGADHVFLSGLMLSGKL